MIDETTEQAAELLDKAHDLLLTDGWCQNRFHEGGRHCSLGAIARVSGTFETVFKPTAYSVVGKAVLALGAITRQSSDVAGGVALWNDNETRTEDEVLDAFRHAAKNLRNQ